MKSFFRKVTDRIYIYGWQKRFWSTKYSINYINKNLKGKNIWLLGIPNSRNLGDQAQVYCSEKWFVDNYPGYAIHKFNSPELMAHNRSLIYHIASVIKKDDIIFFQSGYNLTDLYPDQEMMHRAVVESIPNNRIIFLPQTVSFKEPIDTNEFARISNACYRKHGKVFLLCRDVKSYEIVKKAMPDVSAFPFPDVVTTLIGKYKVGSKEKEGVLLCVRHDQESALDESSFSQLDSILSTYKRVTKIDTTIDYPNRAVIRFNRKKYIFSMIDKMSEHQIVITDRYHGLIFAIISNTPVIILKTIDHKITEGVKWFPDDIKKYIRIADNISEIPKHIEELKKLPQMKCDIYFSQEYYDKLKGIINSYIGMD